MTALAFGLAAAAFFVGTKSSDSSESSPFALRFFLAAALMAALVLGLADFKALISASRRS
jgi:hypothetical protein